MFQASSTAHLDCHFFLFSNFLRIFFNCRTSIQSPVFDQITGRLGDKGIPPIFITKLIPAIDHRATGRRHRPQGAAERPNLNHNLINTFEIEGTKIHLRHSLWRPSLPREIPPDIKSVATKGTCLGTFCLTNGDLTAYSSGKAGCHVASSLRARLSLSKSR